MKKVYSTCFQPEYFLKKGKWRIVICYGDAKNEIESWNIKDVVFEYFKKDLNCEGGGFFRENGEIVLFKDFYENPENIFKRVPESVVIEDFFRKRIFELSREKRD